MREKNRKLIRGGWGVFGLIAVYAATSNLQFSTPISVFFSLNGGFLSFVLADEVLEREVKQE